MPMNNVFDSDIFSLVSLTTALEKLPYIPSRIGQLGLFGREGIPTVTAMVEENNGLLGLVPFSARGGPGVPHKTGKRVARSLVIPHIALFDELKAESVQGVRAFGSENQFESVATVVNQRLTRMKQDIEVTMEYHRANAIQGYVRDADNSVSYNLFETFGVTKPTAVDFVFGTDTTDVRGKCLDLIDGIETAMGGAATYDHIHCLCGLTWFKKLIAHKTVAAAYERWQNGEMLRNDPRAGFEFAGITFEVYKGTVSGRTFIPATDARFFPMGVPELFVEWDAPADYMEMANTFGLPMYAKSEPLELNKGVKIEVQSNPLCICTRPGVLYRGYSST